MEYNSALPIYLQVMMDIQRNIVTGVLSPGEKLPSVRELALHYTINPNTANRVYRELESEGVCFTRRGMGTFVTEDAGKIDQMREEMADQLVEQYLEGMSRLGYSKEKAVRRLDRESCRSG